MLSLSRNALLLTFSYEFEFFQEIREQERYIKGWSFFRVFVANRNKKTGKFRKTDQWELSFLSGDSSASKRMNGGTEISQGKLKNLRMNKCPAERTSHWTGHQLWSEQFTVTEIPNSRERLGEGIVIAAAAVVVVEVEEEGEQEESYLNQPWDQCSLPWHRANPESLSPSAEARDGKHLEMLVGQLKGGRLPRSVDFHSTVGSWNTNFASAEEKQNVEYEEEGAINISTEKQKTERNREGGGGRGERAEVQLQPSDPMGSDCVQATGGFTGYSRLPITCAIKAQEPPARDQWRRYCLNVPRGLFRPFIFFLNINNIWYRNNLSVASVVP